MYRITLRHPDRKKDRKVLVEADRDAESQVSLADGEYVYDICRADATSAEVRSMGSPSSNRK